MEKAHMFKTTFKISPIIIYSLAQVLTLYNPKNKSKSK